MSSTQSVLGSIVSLWRYPVKSMMGEELNASEVTKGGLLGDRAYALIDTADGKVATAKNPRKWPQLFNFRAALTNAPRTGVKMSPVRITLPDGTIVHSEQPDLYQALSKVLKREVILDASANVQQKIDGSTAPDLRPQRKNTGQISKASSTVTPSPTSVCLRGLFSTAPSCIC
jgi:uncharacterized protein YcbX